VKPEAAKRLALLASAVTILVVVAGVGAGWFYNRVRASRPQLEGQALTPGLTARVVIERDALGVPRIRGNNRRDVSRALGWLHGQERFFQMDLLRRSAAGELAAIFGKKALPRDRLKRMHGFRALAQKVVAGLPAEDRALVEAYSAGVNAGLGALGEKPFEYLVLRDTPLPWKPEDTFLVGYAMMLDLQEDRGRYEQTLMTLRDQLGLEGLAFFAPLVGPNDAALDGSTAAAAPIPGPHVIDLRKRAKVVGTGSPMAPVARSDDELATADPFPQRDPEAVPGSNSLALSGAHTANGGGILANDMHLDNAVPNIWYRASLVTPELTVTGVTLPGTPLVITGSNGHITWGFTNSYVDTSDLVVVETNSLSPVLYPAPGYGTLQEIENRPDTILVKDGEPEKVTYPWTVWGPIVGTNDKKRPLALRWVAHDVAAANLQLMSLERAKTVEAAIAAGHRAGIAQQNLMVTDTTGKVAWTIAGALPKRVGFDGRLPVSWAFGDRRWDGLLASEDVPKVIVPTAEPARTQLNSLAQSGRLWSGNQRMVGGDALAKLGDGGYARPYRAAQLRDGLAAIEKATPRDLLAVQLDDRALFLERWYQLLLKTLDPAADANRSAHAKLRPLVEKWSGRAEVASVSYSLVRAFRTAVYARVFPPIFERCVEINPNFRTHELHLEDAVWALLREKPRHLLNPDFTRWENLLVQAVDDVITHFDEEGVRLEAATWGGRNVAQIRHPFSYSLPKFVARFLNLPPDELPGDQDMPRVQGKSHGASERMVVAPGREAEGIFHMPGGQSGHPLSPFFRAGHAAWVRGEPTPFLPGETAHTLILEP